MSWHGTWKRHGAPPGILDEALLIVSELAANAILHSRSGHPGGTFTVRTELHDSYLFIEVQDEGGLWKTHVPADGRPHGFDILNGLCGADDWGVDNDDTGRVAWARLDLPSGGGQ
jgi:serine/threonine-protein kinase RsbW